MSLRVSRNARWLLSMLAVLAVSLSFVPQGLTLSGSTFNAIDGNLAVQGTETDWANAPNRKVGVDIPTGQSDDSLGQGAKENDGAPSVVTGSIPNQKSDLTRFYVANEDVAAGSFLYLAWERANTLGTANIDFEFSQSTALSENGVTPARTANDMLITYDFAKGGNAPSIGLLRWVTSANGSAADCFSGNSLPCWGKRLDLSGQTHAEGSINSGTIDEPIAGGTLADKEFGEAAINLTASNVVQPGVCINFGRAYAKSRSSDSFTAELKDFIRPIPVNIDTCGKLTISKQDDAGSALAGASFTITPNPVPNGTGSSLTVADGGTGDDDGTADGTVTLNSVNPGTYQVCESTAPTGFVKAATCISNVVVGNSAAVNVGPFVNTLGAINITKNDALSGIRVAVAGAEFTISPNPWFCHDGTRNGTGTPSAGATGSITVVDNGANDENSAAGAMSIGRVCLLESGYSVEETVAPQGYSLPTSNSQGPVALTASTSNVTLSFTFSDPPMLTLLVQVVRADTGAVVNNVVLALGTTNTASSTANSCTYSGADSQSQGTASAAGSDGTGMWTDLSFNCLGTSAGYQLNITTPSP